MKRIIILLCLLLLSGCGNKEKKYEAQFFDVFDTVSFFTCYADNKQQAQEYETAVHNYLLNLHKMSDPYNTYDGINNLKTINDNAAVAPVDISAELYDILIFGKSAYEKTDGSINIAMGNTLELWHKYRQNATENNIISIPSDEELKKTAQFNDISALELNENTAYITKKGVSLNLGAIAKGYAADGVIEMLKQMGCKAALINLGGNVACYGGDVKQGGWNIGIQDPINTDNLLQTVNISEGSLVSSGNYQRYYMYNGKKIHHIINPETLMPAENFSGVTIISDDSKTGDLLSTALFILPLEDGKKLAKQHNVEQVYWVDNSGRLTTLN